MDWILPVLTSISLRNTNICKYLRQECYVLASVFWSVCLFVNRILKTLWMNIVKFLEENISLIKNNKKQ